jgi:hypothetical protein
MKFRPDHLQHIAAAKAGFSERTARRIETNRHLAPQPNAVRTRQGPDPFDGLWDSEIRPLLETHPGLRPVAVLERCSAVIPIMTGIGCVAAWSVGFAPGGRDMAPIAR